MFVLLLAITFVVAFAVSFLIARLFKRPIESILQRIIQDEISLAWVRYLSFALYVVGISGGVRFWDLEKYITPGAKDGQILQLNSDRWVLEIYRTIIGTLQGIAWMLLVFFLFSLIAYVVVRISESRRPKVD
ncbi:MAG: hypothetical protein HY650_13340 [Acidobacteria bacterium]|nr:hypothetical protein [Acidobacteriota bacterium]